MTDFLVCLFIQKKRSYRICVLFSSSIWQAGVMFEKTLEGLCFGKAEIKWLQNTVNNPLFPFPSLIMRNILHSQMYNNTEGHNTEHILRALHIQEYSFQDVGKVTNFNCMMSWSTAISACFGDCLLQTLPKQWWTSPLLCLLFLREHVCLEATAIYKPMIVFCDAVAVCNDSIQPIHATLPSGGSTLGIPSNY